MHNAQHAPHRHSGRSRRWNAFDASSQRQAHVRSHSPVPDEPLPNRNDTEGSPQESTPTAEDVERIAQLIRRALPLQNNRSFASIDTVDNAQLHSYAQLRATAQPLHLEQRAQNAEGRLQRRSINAQNAIVPFFHNHHPAVRTFAQRHQQQNAYSMQPLQHYHPELYVYQGSSAQCASTLRPVKIVLTHTNGHLSEHYPSLESCLIRHICLPITVQPQRGSTLSILF
ncbi:hypothetical protein Tcan_14415 [Toxocara canis]|uniref:Uncharacterized protein n=1 Tax=Toxocara canis TaxID=6265 RepID=A0A0B2V1H6_TOXCA|nr:hypothetical protein Tcan_14415 [Toxocara canis]